MDPNEALRLAREAAGEIMNADDDDTLPGSNVGQLVESFNALDDWIAKGGFLPQAWTGPRENLIVTITNPPGQEGAEYRLTVPSGESVIIGDAQDQYWTLARIIDDAFEGREHVHMFGGQRLVHTHRHDGPHGYFEHPEDGKRPAEGGRESDVPYALTEGEG